MDIDQIPWLDQENYLFPEPSLALDEPNGLLAMGGDLDPQRIIKAYQQSIFPWYENGQPIMWWSPNPRMVLIPDELHIAKSLKKALKKSPLTITYDQAFTEVIEACADRNDGSDTWITRQMQEAYLQLFEMGYAHSVEAWHNGKIVGGLYGLSIGKVFCGESMFSREKNAAKIAFVNLVQRLKKQGYSLIDCQIASEFLASFGAREISRNDFIAYLPSADETKLNSQWPSIF